MTSCVCAAVVCVGVVGGVRHCDRNNETFAKFYLSRVRNIVEGTGRNDVSEKDNSFCLMVEASDHGYVLHTRRIHVTRYRIRYDIR
jgi:hypothetical protein